MMGRREPREVLGMEGESIPERGDDEEGPDSRPSSLCTANKGDSGG